MYNAKEKLLTLSDKYKNQPAIVCGLGPSLLELDKEKYKDNIVITCNQFYRVPNFFDNNFSPLFWCGANQLNILKQDMDRCVDHNIKNILFTVGGNQDKADIESFVESKKDKLNCFYWDLDKKDLHNVLKEKFNMRSTYSIGTTVAVHMIALALLLGCNPISFVGIDFKYGTQYTHAGFNNADFIKNKEFQSEYEINCIKHDMFYFSLLAEKHNIDIYNLSYKINGLTYFKVKD